MFLFVDNQLNEISEKLKDAEVDLSEFKSETKIFNLDESSEEVIKFLSDLETEKVKIDINKKVKDLTTDEVTRIRK